MQKKQLFFLSLIVVVLLGTQSCVKHREMVALNRTDQQRITIDGTPLYESEVYPYSSYKLQPHDQLMVKINAFDGSTEDFLDREFKTAENFRDIRFDEQSMYYNTYTVHKNGYLYLPVIDSVYAKGLSTMELKLKIDKAYKDYLKYPYTTIKLANMKCTVLGEVNQPGVQYLYNEDNTLLDAIGLSGGMTEFGNRTNVKVVRKMRGGNTKTVYLDLTTYDFVRTEFYYVHPDDIIYVEPVKAKSFDASSRAIGVIFSAISTLALIVNLVWQR